MLYAWGRPGLGGIAGRRRVQLPALVAVVVGLAERLLALDAAVVAGANGAARRWPGAGRVVELTAGGLAGLQVVLMLVVGLTGRPRAVGRMLLAVCTVYVAVEGLGLAWRRGRPFAQLETVQAVIPHAEGRSFPSRHVASAVAMALLGARSRPRLGRLMAGVAGLLALGRVGAGLHYPSDVLAGAALGLLVGRAFRDWP